MGWLRDLMGHAAPPIRSFGELGRAALAHPAWPQDTRPAARSLASVFSKLDREIELGWLEDRPEVQHVLAELLGCPLADVRQALLPAAAADEPSRLLRLADVRDARSVDLLDEALPPGFPPDVLRPGAWDALWWQAPPGSGRSLAGRWLEARGMAAFVRGKQAAPARGPVYVELDDEGPEPAPRPRLCVAAAFAPSQPGWQVVRSPQPLSYLAELVAWVEARLPADDRFDARQVLVWLREHAELIDGFGTALGLCGVADELGVRQVRGKSLGEIAERFFVARLAEASERGSAEASWLKRSGFRVLVGMLRGLLTDESERWDTPRSFDQWLALVPDEFQRGGDVEWLRISLARADSPVRPSDIEKAARVVPPGAYRTVRALMRAGLMTEGHDGRLVLGPRWFGLTLLNEARRSLVDGSPLGWGDALLQPGSAPTLASALEKRLQRDPGSLVDEVLELEGAEPARAAAVEAAFVGVGLATLRELDMAPELLEGLWEEQLALVLELDHELPRPRIAHGAPQVWLSYAGWLLAALALSEQLGNVQGSVVLAPWQAPEPPPELEHVYDIIAESLPHFPEALALAGFALVDRLRRTIGHVRPGGTPHALELPGVVLDEAAHGVLVFENVALLGERGIDAAAHLVSERGESWPPLAEALWRAWAEAGCPTWAAPSARSELLWPHIPVDVLLGIVETHAIDFFQLGDAAWQALVGCCCNRTHRLPPAAFRAMPPEHVQSLLDERAALDPDQAHALWMRYPELLFSTLERWQEAEPTRAVGLVVGAPPERTRDLAAWLIERIEPLNLPEAELNALRRWLCRAIDQRAAGWREVYAIFADIERKLGSTRGLPSPY